MLGEEKGIMVSIIVPVYNTAKFVEKTIQSILNQTYTDWEVILIDDGSTDDSLTICEDMAKRNKKIRVYHQKNKGPAETRNVGIGLSRGEYLVFVDSDDELCRNFLYDMVEELEKNKADVVFCGLRRICGEKIIEQLYEEASYSRDEYYIASYDKTKFKTRSSCTAIYKKDVIVENNVLFPKDLICGEDSIFVQKFISYCSTNIITTNKCYYDYINQNPNSTTKNIFYDHYMLEYQLYHEAYAKSTDKLNFLNMTSQRYIDILIKEMICFVAYSSESFTKKMKQLNKIVKDDLTQKAIKIYKVNNPEHSRCIPYAIRRKQPFIMFLALRYRIIRKGYKKKRVKVRSIWR